MTNENVDRLARGKSRKGASFPVAPGRTALPTHYHDLLHEVKETVLRTRLHTVLAANSAMVSLYWEIGRSIVERQAQEGWGAKVIDRLSQDLREAFPEMNGFSARNLRYMRAFSSAWPDRSCARGPCTIDVVPQPCLAGEAPGCGNPYLVCEKDP